MEIFLYAAVVVYVFCSVLYIWQLCERVSSLEAEDIKQDREIKQLSTSIRYQAEMQTKLVKAVGDRLDRLYTDFEQHKLGFIKINSEKPDSSKQKEKVKPLNFRKKKNVV